MEVRVPRICFLNQELVIMGLRWKNRQAIN